MRDDRREDVIDAILRRVSQRFPSVAPALEAIETEVRFEWGGERLTIAERNGYNKADRLAAALG